MDGGKEQPVGIAKKVAVGTHLKVLPLLGKIGYFLGLPRFRDRKDLSMEEGSTTHDSAALTLQ